VRDSRQDSIQELSLAEAAEAERRAQLARAEGQARMTLALKAAQEHAHVTAQLSALAQTVDEDPLASDPRARVQLGLEYEVAASAEAVRHELGGRLAAGGGQFGGGLPTRLSTSPRGGGPKLLFKLSLLPVSGRELVPVEPGAPGAPGAPPGAGASPAAAASSSAVSEASAPGAPGAAGAAGAAMEAGLARAFRAIDKNRDGRVTRTEVRLLVYTTTGSYQ
jgi:hypothetical protein